MREAGLPPWTGEDERARYAVGDDLYDLTPRVLDNLRRLEVDVLVTIGGDDTLSYSQVLVNDGVALMAIPKTMDNDVQGTEYCIGFRPRSRAPRWQSTASAPPSAATSGSASSGSSARCRLLRAVHRLRDVGPVRHPEAPYDLDALAAPARPPTTPPTRATTPS